MLSPMIADGGEMTVMRHVASHAYGSITMTYPQGEEPEGADPDVSRGFIYRLRPDEALPPFGRGFVRTDVDVNAETGESSVESVLDEAEARTAGEPLFQRDITRAGLGRLVPDVDFTVGDVVPVRLWGRIIDLPVTAVDALSGPGAVLDWRVHVGGQLLRDDVARASANLAVERQIMQERHERQQAIRGVVSAVQAARDEQQDVNVAQAQATADAAQAAADAVTAQQELAEVTQAEQFVLHDNQLKWLSWSKHFYDFVFSPESGATTRVGRSIDTGLVDIRVNTQSGMGVEVIIRPGWRGRWRLDWTQVGGTDTGDLSGWEAGTRTNATSTAYQTDKIIRRVELSVWPEHSSAPREWVVRVASGADGGSTFVAPELTMGTLTISGAPVQQPAGAVRFSTPVVAAGDVTANGLLCPSGTTIPLGTDIRPVANETAGLILFTEVKPTTTWEPGAPLSGRQILPIASQTIPRSTWVTLAEWTGLAWSTARTATIELIVQWAKYNSWALADYYIRITRNGTQIGYLARGTTGGMDTHFKIELTGQTLRAGDVLRFEARATPGYASERKIASASADITWT